MGKRTLTVEPNNNQPSSHSNQQIASQRGWGKNYLWMEKAMSVRYNIPPDDFNLRELGNDALDFKSYGSFLGKC